jgi:glycosyltransferase involved in cell wall biosynthesis
MERLPVDGIADVCRSSPFSVVIPAYNSASTLPATLESIHAQTEPPREIIVVDDGSSDQTARVASDYGAKVISQKNAGPGAARATGSLVAKSDYIAYLDGDDWWVKDWLATARSVIETTGIHFLFSDLRRSEPGREESQWGPPASSAFPWFADFIAAHAHRERTDLHRLDPTSGGMALLLKAFPIFPSTVIVRKHSLLACGNWATDFRRAEDFATWLRLAAKYPLHYLDRVSAILGLHEVNRDWRKYTHLQSSWDLKVLEHHWSTSEDAAYSSALAQRYCSLAWLYRTEGRKREARELYVRAIRHGKRVHALTRWCLSWIPTG